MGLFKWHLSLLLSIPCKVDWVLSYAALKQNKRGLNLKSKMPLRDICPLSLSTTNPQNEAQWREKKKKKNLEKKWSKEEEEYLWQQWIRMEAAAAAECGWQQQQSSRLVGRAVKHQSLVSLLLLFLLLLFFFPLFLLVAWNGEKGLVFSFIHFKTKFAVCPTSLFSP